MKRFRKIAEIPLTREEYRLEQNEKKRKRGYQYNQLLIMDRKMNKLEDIIVAKYQLFSDKEKEQAQNEIRLFKMLTIK